MAAEHEQGGPIDPWSPEALRVDGSDDIDVVKVVLHVPARKPNRDEFFRVHPGEDYTLDVLAYERKEGMDRETFLVAPSLQTELVGNCWRARLFTCVNTRKAPFLWPARLPGPDRDGGRTWAVSRLEVAEEAKKHWLKMYGNKEAGAYEMFVALGDLGEPAWPGMPFGELLKLAFKERFLDSPHHDVIRELRGEL
jgi:hypothetical protein